MHPIVLYFKIDGDIELQKHSICFISDDMEHDTAFVYETQKHVTNYIKDNLPLVSKIYYFSDGCGGQYKNYKNFLNLCNHKNDFGLVAEWIFFATSHGKENSSFEVEQQAIKLMDFVACKYDNFGGLD